MPVYKDEKRKTWYVQYKYKDPVTGNWHVKKKRGFATKRDAKEAERQMTENSDTSGLITFKTIAEQYDSYKQLSPDQHHKHQVHFEKRFSEYYNSPISKITVPQLVAWQTDLAKSTACSTKTKNDTISFVRAVFAYANMVYGIPDVGKSLISIRKTKEEQLQEMQVWTVKEFKTFAKSVELETYRLFFTFLFWTGCRRGEAMALQKSDISGNTVTISKSIKHFKNGFQPTKTGATRRIYIDNDLLADLKPLLEQEGPFVFGGDHSLPISGIDKQFHNAIEASGVKKIRLHDLRHSHASLLINNNVNIVAVSKRLGHASIEQTLKTYTHLLEDTDKKMASTIRKLHKK